MRLVNRTKRPEKKKARPRALLVLSPTPETELPREKNS